MLYGDGIHDDTAVLQEMLDRQGIVTIDRPGTYLITTTLIIHSNTRFILTPGAVLLAARMSRCALIEAEMAVLRNRYFKTYHDEHPFRNMILIDTTDLTIDEAANQVEAYIKQQMKLKAD